EWVPSGPFRRCVAIGERTLYRAKVTAMFSNAPITAGHTHLTVNWWRLRGGRGQWMTWRILTRRSMALFRSEWRSGGGYFSLTLIPTLLRYILGLGSCPIFSKIIGLRKCVARGVRCTTLSAIGRLS